jgi:hypothetical protein
MPKYRVLVIEDTLELPVDDGKIDQLLADHNRFLDAFGKEVRVRITDDTFKDRLAVAYEAVNGFVGERRFE